MAFGVVLSDIGALMSGDVVGGLRFALTFFVVGGLLSLPLLWSMVQSWRAGEGTLWARLRMTGFASLALLFVILLNYWNLLGWKLG